MSPLTGGATAFAIVLVMVVALAAMAIVVVNSLSHSAWGVFTLAATVPIALAMGWYTHRIRPSGIVEATLVGVVCLIGALLLGKGVADGFALVCAPPLAV